MKRFGTGNDVVIEAALAAGCKLFAGYPITPCSEILEAAAARFPEHGRIVIPAENEIAAIHMVAGASLAGYRAMTATSGIGLSLMGEGISFFSGMCQLPGVIICQQRWGPGDGSLGPGQDSYRQAVHGSGHGDFRVIVLAPCDTQETADLVVLAFSLADRYGLFVIVLGDQLTALTSELFEVAQPADPPRRADPLGEKLRAEQGRAGYVVQELLAVDHKAGDFHAIERLARGWESRYQEIERTEARYAGTRLDENLDGLIVAYGSLARTATAALTLLDRTGKRFGVFRPITLWPFPEDALADAAARSNSVVVAELSMGQLVDDVRRVIGRRPESFVNWLGGVSPSPDEFAERVVQAASNP